jgi:hypothetical protein
MDFCQWFELRWSAVDVALINQRLLFAPMTVFLFVNIIL